MSSDRQEVFSNGDEIMIINIETKQIKELIESVALKGKYNSGDVTKNGQLSNYAHIRCDDEYVYAYNADSTTICSARLMVRDVSLGDKGIGTAIIDIEKTVKYLKGFNEEISLDFGDYLTITAVQGTAIGKVPLVSEHPHSASINRAISLTTDIRSETPSWGDELPIFGKTQYEAEIIIPEEEIRRAGDGCDVVNIARYKFDYEDEVLTMSSSKTITEAYSTEVEYTIAEGDSATVEFNGQFAKFLNGVVRLYLKDDAPILFVTPHRLLLKAPYINR